MAAGRLEICQKIYTTGFSDQKFYTLKVTNLNSACRFWIKWNSCKKAICLGCSYEFVEKIWIQIKIKTRVHFSIYALSRDLWSVIEKSRQPHPLLFPTRENILRVDLFQYPVCEYVWISCVWICLNILCVNMFEYPVCEYVCFKTNSHVLYYLRQ